MPTLSHACVRVLDLARSVAFYRETLGIYFIQDPDGHILEILPPD